MHGGFSVSNAHTARNLMVFKQIRIAVTTLILFTVLTGGIYPLAVTGIGQLIFPRQANGSLLTRGGKTIGSGLIGQPFSGPGYFWGRLSATSPFPDNAGLSSASNLGPNNPALLDAVRKRITDLKSADPDNDRPVPVDLVTASGSGLDPHISVASAMYQVPRIARVRGLTVDNVRQLVNQWTEERQFGVLGERRVNFLQLNLALDTH
jgi:K+-transporting ATPase ATPase C chain